MFGFAERRAASMARGGVKVVRLLGYCAKLLTERGQAVSTSLGRDRSSQRYSDAQTARRRRIEGLGARAALRRLHGPGRGRKPRL